MSSSLSSPNPSLTNPVESRPVTSAAPEPQPVTQSATSSSNSLPDPPSSSSPSSPSSSSLPQSQSTARRVARPVAAKGASKSKLRKDDGRLVRGRKSRARIREAALSLFRERGFDGATLRAIAERAGMGASSIYRHVQSKEELLIDELSQMQEEAWSRFRVADDRNRPPAERLLDFFDVQHELLVENRDLTTIALRATTKTEARVAKRVLQLYDRTIGLLMEILQHGRMKKHLARDVDVLETARVLFHVTNGARIPWANGMVADDALRDSIHQAVYLLFRGVSAQPLAPSAPSSSPSPSLPSSPSSSLPQTEAPPGLAGAAGVPAESPTPRRAGLLTDPR